MGFGLHNITSALKTGAEATVLSNPVALAFLNHRASSAKPAKKGKAKTAAKVALTPLPNPDDLRQQFLDAFMGPTPAAPDQGAYLQPFDQASNDLGAQYTAAHQAIQAQLPELQQKLASIQTQAAALANIGAQQSGASQQNTAGIAQQASTGIQDRLGALGVSAAPIAARAELGAQAAGQAQSNRDAFMQRQALVTQASDADRQASATNASASALGALDANRLRAAGTIDQGKAQAMVAFQQAQQQAQQNAFNQRLSSVKGLQDIESEFNPINTINNSLLPAKSLELAQQTVQNIEGGELSPEDALQKLHDNAATFKAKGYDPTAIASAIRKAYSAARKQREAVLKQLQGN